MSNTKIEEIDFIKKEIIGGLKPINKC